MSGMRFLFCLFLLMQTNSLAAWVFNDPYPRQDRLKNIYYASFTEQPKTLDPALSYSANEYQFLAQIYEPLLGYDYYQRPYQLIPVTAEKIPTIRYTNAQGEPLVNARDDAYSVYTISIRPGIYYQPHPAFARTASGDYRYLNLPDDYIEDHGVRRLSDFKHTGTRELVSDDYIYQIKRLANPLLSSPIYGLMSDYILGFKEYGALLPKKSGYIDLREYPIKGIRKLDDYHFEITLKKPYSQFLFWLAMPFFSPLPWEVDCFYNQPGFSDRNLTLSWYPVGTGPFTLAENNPNQRMVLTKNPNYREEYFPTPSASGHEQFAKNAGKRLPLIDKAVYTLEKESIPRWNKFLQGYYDDSAITNDSFDQAIRINHKGEVTLTSEMKHKKIYLTQTLEPSVYYLGFNMLDPVVGGYSAKARALRQAISIAINYEEYIAIFSNGRGIAAQGPIPPGIFGREEGASGMNPYVYDWVQGQAVRKPLAKAKQLLSIAGYPQGIDPKTGKPLILHYDVATTGSPEEKGLLDWMRKQFAQLGIDLNVRSTLYNRFQEKVRAGNTQIFSWGWIADYPDPENFLFQLYGANGKVKYGGENATNYRNPEFDRLFNLMKNRPNDNLRQGLINQMQAIVLRDSPWVWGIHTENFTLAHQWKSMIKTNPIYLANLKYVSVDVNMRAQLRTQWNQPLLWPLGALLLFLLMLLVPVLISYRRKENKPASRDDLS